MNDTMCIAIHIGVNIMRTNIVLDDQLITEALKLSGRKTKKDVVDFALQKLVQSLRRQPQKHNQFINKYVNSPIKLDQFTPLSRNDIYER